MKKPQSRNQIREAEKVWKAAALRNKVWVSPGQSLESQGETVQTDFGEIIRYRHRAWGSCTESTVF